MPTPGKIELRMYRALSDAYWDIGHIMAFLPENTRNDECMRPQRERREQINSILSKFERTWEMTDMGQDAHLTSKR